MNKGINEASLCLRTRRLPAVTGLVGIVGALLTSLLLLPACSGSRPKDGTPSSGVGGSGTEEESGSFSGTLTPIEVAQGGAPRQVTAVREAAHSSYDRMVWEHGPDGSGYRVAYVDAPVLSCGSGEPVTLEGGAVLTVTLLPAVAHSEDGKSLLATKQLKPGHISVKSMEQICDFEGRVTWAIGVRERLPVRVSLLKDPARLVVDVQH